MHSIFKGRACIPHQKAPSYYQQMKCQKVLQAEPAAYHRTAACDISYHMIWKSQAALLQDLQQIQAMVTLQSPSSTGTPEMTPCRSTCQQRMMYMSYLGMRRQMMAWVLLPQPCSSWRLSPSSAEARALLTQSMFLCQQQSLGW